MAKLVAFNVVSRFSKMKFLIMATTEEQARDSFRELAHTRNCKVERVPEFDNLDTYTNIIEYQYTDFSELEEYYENVKANYEAKLKDKLTAEEESKKKSANERANLLRQKNNSISKLTAELEKTKTDSEKKIATLDSIVKNDTKTIVELSDKNKLLEEENEKLKSLNKSQFGKIGNLSQRVKTLETKIKVYTDREDSINAQEKNLAERTKTIDKIKIEQDKYSARLKQQSENLNVREENIREFIKDINTLITVFTNYKEQLTKLKKEIDCSFPDRSNKEVKK